MRPSASVASRCSRIDVVGLAAFLVVGGLANSAANPAANLLLVEVVPLERRGFALGVKQAAIPIATLLAGLSIPVFALTLGWRWAFAAAALAALAIAGFGLTRSRAATGRRSGAAPGGRTPSAGLRDRRDLLLLAAAAALGIWGGQAMGAFLVSYSVDVGQDPATAGLILTVASLSGIAARIGAGWLVDRRRADGVTELMTLLAIGSVGLLLIAIGLPILIWLGAVLGFAGGWGWSGVLTYVAVRTNPEAPAAATGITQAGVFLGATIGVPLFGILVETSSYTTAWVATSISLILALGIVAIVSRRLPRVSR